MHEALKSLIDAGWLEEQPTNPDEVRGLLGIAERRLEELQGSLKYPDSIFKTAIRQMVDVASGRNVYRGAEAGYHNVRAYVTRDGRSLIVECRAESYLEPMSRYLFLIDNEQDEVSNTCLSDGMFMGGFDKATLDDGRAFNAFAMSVDRGPAPGFPFVVKLEPRKPTEVKLVGVMRALKQDRYGFIPTVTPA